MSAFHLKTEIVSVGSVYQMCETTEFREGLPDTHFLVYKYNCTSCNSCNVGETKFSHNWIENLVTDFVSGRFKLKKISCANYVWIYLLTGRWWSVPGRWQSCFGRAYRRWHGKWGIFHQGTRNMIFIGYGNFCRHGFKTWKRWPNFFSFNPCPSYPGYKRFSLASGWVPRCRSQADSWPKPETAHEKSVAPRVCPSLPSVAKDDRKQF